MTFIRFLVDNWKIITEVVLLLGAFILFLVKKRPNQIVDTICETVIAMLPSFIQAAEKEIGAGNGALKKQRVFDFVALWFEQQGYEFTEFYKVFVDKYIEAILLCPQKK